MAWSCTPWCDAFKCFLLETLQMNNWYIRALYYIALSVLMYFDDHVWTVFAGIITDFMAASYAMAQWQGLRDDDGGAADMGYVPSV